jgi:chitin synthase
MQNMKELDESFQQTVKRAVAPFKPDTKPEEPNMDVSRVASKHSGKPGLTPQDQNRTFRTRLVSFWLISNAALAISIQTLSGLGGTKEMVEACLPSEFNPQNGTVVVPINGTCIEQAVSFDQTRLQDRQQQYFKYLLWATFGLSAVRFLGVSGAGREGKSKASGGGGMTLSTGAVR